VEKTGRFIEKKATGNEPSLPDFREYRIKKGQKVPTKDQFIQKRSRRLSSRAERRAIQQARKNTFIGKNKRRIL
jgi:hypothetical protein